MTGLVYAGGGIIMAWGVMHLAPTRQIVKGFGDISADNKKVLAMEVIAEGLTLLFLGLLSILVAALGDAGSRTAHVVFAAAGVMLLVMALVTALTGARTPVIWYKLCPAVKTLAAVLILVGGLA